MIKPVLNTTQIDLMKHCIGIDYKKIKRRKYEAYRNSFTTPNNNSNWEDIVGKGLADKIPSPLGGGDDPQVYRLNEQGFQFLSDLLECKITG